MPKCCIITRQRMVGTTNEISDGPLWSVVRMSIGLRLGESTWEGVGHENEVWS